MLDKKIKYIGVLVFFAAMIVWTNHAYQKSSFLPIVQAEQAKLQDNIQDIVHDFNTLQVDSLEKEDILFSNDMVPAAHRIELYEDYLKGKNIALLVNHTATIGETHLVDTLLQRGHKIVKIFAPEHGFRGDADNGENIKSGIDEKTQIPIVSLYGSNKKPTAKDFENIDIVIFDIQDVGVRFYTYTTSMTYMMEACALFNKPFLVLDRPNPLGHYVDGAVLNKELSSFIGLHPVPIVHGLTVAEYAKMINEEGWLPNNLKVDLITILVENYAHDKYYKLPANPSPNLTDMKGIYLYPSICLFEGTHVSLGRGTDAPFQRLGHPKYPNKDYIFKPQATYGSKNPPHKDTECYGYDLTNIDIKAMQMDTLINISYILDFYKNFPKEEKFFIMNKDNSSFFDKLAGTKEFRAQIMAGASEEEIRASWKADLDNYKALRAKYLLYP